MLVYRVTRTKWALSLDGEGARLHGGRWNHIGVPCVYTSESRALAILEFTVNTNIDDIPRALSIVTIDIPDNDAFDFHLPSIASLPGDWLDSSKSQSTKDFGTDLLRRNFHGIVLPSVVVPREFNYLLNPLQTSGNSFTIIDVDDFVYDLRIKNI